MAEVGHLVSARNVSPIPSSYPTKAKSLKFQCRIRAASKRNDFSLVLWTPFGSWFCFFFFEFTLCNLSRSCISFQNHNPPMCVFYKNFLLVLRWKAKFNTKQATISVLLNAKTWLPTGSLNCYLNYVQSCLRCLAALETFYTFSLAEFRWSNNYRIYKFGFSLSSFLFLFFLIIIISKD